MAWVLRLVETDIDGPARVIGVMDITPFGALGDMSKLGLMLSEAKRILARLRLCCTEADSESAWAQFPKVQSVF
jgi:hypothetical protein